MTMNITQTKIYKTREIIKRRKIRLIIFYNHTNPTLKCIALPYVFYKSFGFFGAGEPNTPLKQSVMGRRPLILRR
jgi:hypothetical protein